MTDKQFDSVYYNWGGVFYQTKHRVRAFVGVSVRYNVGAKSIYIAGYTGATVYKN